MLSAPSKTQNPWKTKHRVIYGENEVSYMFFRPDTIRSVLHQACDISYPCDLAHAAQAGPYFPSKPGKVLFIHAAWLSLHTTSSESLPSGCRHQLTDFSAHSTVGFHTPVLDISDSIIIYNRITMPSPWHSLYDVDLYDPYPSQFLIYN